jgi:hypothetical protein
METTDFTFGSVSYLFVIGWKFSEGMKICFGSFRKSHQDRGFPFRKKIAKWGPRKAGRIDDR